VAWPIVAPDTEIFCEGEPIRREDEERLVAELSDLKTEKAKLSKRSESLAAREKDLAVREAELHKNLEGIADKEELVAKKLKELEKIKENLMGM